MYNLAVGKDFIAQHFLIGGDWGPENQKHSHHYRMEVQLQGKDLDNHDFLVDIAKVKDELEKIIFSYRDHTLNNTPEFKDINPSVENLACILYQNFRRSLQGTGIAVFKLKCGKMILPGSAIKRSRSCRSAS